MKRIILFSFFLILLGCLTNCVNRVTNGIEVSELLLLASREQGIDYCKMLNKAINGDADSIRQFALLEFGDAAGYDHGSVIVKMIKLVGEDSFIQSLSTINDEQKRLIKGYIDAGLEYGTGQPFEVKTINDVFPKLGVFLTTD